MVVLLPTTLERGLFSGKTTCLPYESCLALRPRSLAAILKGDKVRRGDVDILFTIIVGLYFLTNL